MAPYLVLMDRRSTVDMVLMATGYSLVAGTAFRILVFVFLMRLKQNKIHCKLIIWTMNTRDTI